MPPRVQPRAVYLGATRAEFADRQVKTRQFAFAARERAHGFGALAVFDVDRNVLRGQRAHQRRDRIPVRRVNPDLAHWARQPPVQLAGHFARQRLKRPVEPLVRQPLRAQHGLAEFGQNGAASARLGDQRAAEPRLDFSQQTPRVPIGQTLSGRGVRDAPGLRNQQQKRHGRAETGFPAIGVAQHEFGTAFDIDHMYPQFLLPSAG